MKRIQEWGPLAAAAAVLGFVVWRQQSLERDLAVFVDAVNRLVGNAAQGLADKATALHEEAVDVGARQN